MNTTAIIEQIRAITTLDDMDRVDALIRTEEGSMAPEVQQALLEKLREVTANSRKALEETKSILQVHGVSYPLTDWLTPRNYALKFGVKNTETVINWINRGVIPADDVREVPELGLRLVRAVPYAPRKHSSHQTVNA
ncbi:hypothetical protein [Spirosoma arcticum]